MNIDWNILIAPVYFFYGLAFYSMGFALWIESGRASELRFARSMRLLAGFGMLHGIHEWFDFLQHTLRLIDGSVLPLWVQWIKVVILIASFISLMGFGEHLRALDRKDGMRIWLIVLAVVWYTLSCIGMEIIHQVDEASWIVICDTLARYIIGIPASIVASLALFRQRKSIQNIQMRKFTIDFMFASVSILIYGVVGQIFVPEAMIFPANTINDNLFLALFGFPIQLIRACLAFVIAVSLIHVLRLLEVENEQRLEAIEKSRYEAEKRSHAELSRLNASLQASEAEARQLLAELKERDSLRTEFLQQVTAAQESERKRIARELHDGTGQMLTGLALGLRGLSKQVHSNPDLVINRLSELEKMATTAIGELRHLIQDLRPPQLDDMGLIPAIRAMLERFRESDGTHYQIEVTGEPIALSSEVETFLFRIIQEGITNVSKHAHADYASVSIRYENGIHICVCDDGVGCNPDMIMDTSSAVRTAWGLHGIDERTRLINANWWLESSPGEGTKLKVHLPMPIEEITQHDN